MKQCAAAFLLFILGSGFALAQEKPAGPASSNTSAAAPQLSQDQIRALIRQAADKDIENDKKQREYTYIEREEQHKLDGNGQVKSSESKTHEIMVLYGEHVERLIAKDDKPLSEKDAAKEEERIQKLTDKRKNESDEQRKKRLDEEEKDREDSRKFVSEVADAYNFRFMGMENLDGRETYVVDAEPQRPDFQPHSKEAKILPKFRFRAWDSIGRNLSGSSWTQSASIRFHWAGFWHDVTRDRSVCCSTRPESTMSLAAPACGDQSGCTRGPAEKL